MAHGSRPRAGKRSSALPVVVSHVPRTINNQLIQRVGLRYCQENDFNDCVVLNNSKTISETLKGNIFMVVNDRVLTPPLKDGSNKNVIRSKIIIVLMTTMTMKKCLFMTLNCKEML